MVETVLEDQFAHFRVLVIQSDKKHVVLGIEVNLQRSTFLLHINIEQLYFIEIRCQSQKVSSLRFEGRSGDSIRLVVLLESNIS